MHILVLKLVTSVSRYGLSKFGTKTAHVTTARVQYKNILKTYKFVYLKALKKNSIKLFSSNCST